VVAVVGKAADDDHEAGGDSPGDPRRQPGKGTRTLARSVSSCLIAGQDAAPQGGGGIAGGRSRRGRRRRSRGWRRGRRARGPRPRRPRICPLHPGGGGPGRRGRLNLVPRCAPWVRITVFLSRCRPVSEAAPDAGLDGAKRRAEALGDFGLGQAGEEGEADGFALIWRDGFEGGFDDLTPFVGLGAFVGVGGGRGLVGFLAGDASPCRGRGAPGSGGGRWLCCERSCRPRWWGWSAGIVGGGLVPDVEEAFLEGVLGFLGVVENLAGEAVEHGGPAGVKLVKGLSVAPGDARRSVASGESWAGTGSLMRAATGGYSGKRWPLPKIVAMRCG
jgi:hypothetical protein